MKKLKTKQILCGIVAVATAFSATACQKAEKAEGKEIKLNWVLNTSGKQSDAEKVWSVWNEKLKEYEGFENTSVSFEIVPSADYKQKLILMQTSETPMDIVSTYTTDFNKDVQNGAYVDLTDMLKGSDIEKEIPEWTIKLMNYDGRIYGVPNYQQMANPMWCYTFNKEDAEQYLDAEALKKEAFSSDILTEKTLDILENYMAKLKSEGKLRQGIRPGTMWGLKGYTDLTSGFCFRYQGDKVVVENRLQVEPYKMYAKRAIDWFKKGYIRKDVLSAEQAKGDYDIWYEQYHKYSEDNYNKTKDKQVKMVQSSENFTLAITTNVGNAISALSKNPEHTFKLMDLMYTEKGKDLYRMLVYGLEGEHYKKITDDRIEPIGYVGSATSDSPYGLAKWSIGNTANAFELNTEPEGWNDYVFNDWNVNAVKSDIMGISFDLSSIESELAQCNAINSEYVDQLVSGALEDFDKTYNEAMEKLEIAGCEKVKAELQRQIDEYIAKNKK